MHGSLAYIYTRNRNFVLKNNLADNVGNFEETQWRIRENESEFHHYLFAASISRARLIVYLARRWNILRNLYAPAEQRAEIRC